MLPQQFDPSAYHPEGPLFVLESINKMTPRVIRAYSKELMKSAATMDRSRKTQSVVNDKPESYWLRKKAQEMNGLAAKITKWQVKHPEMLKSW